LRRVGRPRDLNSPRDGAAGAAALSSIAHCA